MRWPAFDHVFFDCDSTLTRVEGIDILADTPAKRAELEALTQAAMDGHVDLSDVYGRRLEAIQPTRAQVADIKRIYKKEMVEDADVVIATLQTLGHNVYIISGGLYEPVLEFGLHLGVPRTHIRAVDLQYDALASDWWQSDQYDWSEQYASFEAGALTISNGKADVVAELLGEQTGRSILIGDGSSDLKAQSAVDLFAGYGGVVARKSVQDASPLFIHSASLAPFLVLAAGPAALRQIDDPEQQTIFEKGLSQIAQGAIEFKDERLKTKFFDAYKAVYPRTNRGDA